MARWTARGIAAGLGLLLCVAAACARKPPSILGFTRIGKSAQGNEEYRHDETGIAMVLLPGGEFWMGSPEEERRRVVEEFLKDRGEESEESRQESRAAAEQGVASERPLHRVVLSPFLIAKHEVSQGVWERVMRGNPSAVKPGGQLASRITPRMREGEGWLALPVDSVRWDDCREFCEKAGLSLPSEAQWEYACRAGTRTAYAFGDTVRAGQVNFRSRLPGPEPVDSFAPNAFGLHHMHGNVREWCADVFDPAFYSKAEAAGPDPICTSGSEYRVRRGGSWAHDAPACRSAARSWESPGAAHYDQGFRPVFLLDGK